ncbi:hypothetical protein JXJ21_05675 [candidate division KSB1 bacterium]|nr:hypothetical protein [candidate division KSB1 bacterium]
MKFSWLIASIILLVLSQVSLPAEDKIPVYPDPVAGQYFKDWLLCGPFPNPLPEGIHEYRHDETSLGFYRDYLKAEGGEGNIRPYAGMKIKHPKGHKLAWTWHHGFMPLIPLDDIFSPKDQVIAYAACVVNSQESRSVILSVTSNDGVRVWQNGELIIDHNTGGTEEPDRDLVPVVLKKGENHFLVKVSQGFGKWSFQFRFLDLVRTVTDLESRAHLFSRPEITETADSWQIFVGQKYKIELLQKSIPASLELTSADGKHLIARYDAFLGETLEIKKSSLNLAPGLYPVHCSVQKPDGLLHTLRAAIFVGEPPALRKSYELLQAIALPDSAIHYGRHAHQIFKCLQFHISEDLSHGNLGKMDIASQYRVVQKYATWIESLKNAPSPYHQIFPAIQKIELTGKGKFELNMNHTLTDETNGVCQADVLRLKRTLEKEKNISLKDAATGGAITLTIVDKMQLKIDPFQLPNAEAYTIDIESGQITVVGASAEGLHYALITLRQLFLLTSELPSAAIIDYPANAHRCAFTYWQVPMNAESEARLMEYIDLKYNEIVIGTGDYRKLDDEKIRDGLSEYFRIARAYHIEPIPTIWLNGDKSWYEGVWLSDEPVKFIDNQATFDFQRLVNIESSRPVLHSERGGGSVYQAGKDYEIVNVEPPVIRRLEKGSIPPDKTIFMDADIVDQRTHRFSKPCPSEERAYQEFEQHIENVVVALKPRKIHVNHDELGIINSDSRCKRKNMMDDELVAEQINRMRDIIKKYDPDIDMIMWADAVNPYHNAGKKALENTCSLLYTDIIMANWFYSVETFEQIDLLELGTKFFADQGFRMYGCPWDNIPNHQTWESTIWGYRQNPKILGLMHTQWSGRNSGHSQTAAINWTGETWLSR